MSGGAGQDLPFPYQLLDSESNGKKYHMIVVAGRNNAAGDRLNALKKEGDHFITGKNPLVTVEVATDPSAQTAEYKYLIGDALSELFAISDAGFTKPGGLSMFEFYQTGTPSIADTRKTPLEWEAFNINVIKNKQRGIAYDASQNILTQLDEAISLGKKPRECRTDRIIQSMHTLLTHC